MFGTSEGYHDAYGGRGILWCMWGIPRVHQGMFSTLGGYLEYSGGYHKYIGGYHDTCAVHVGGYYDVCEGYQEYIRGCSVHRGYHEYIGRISWCMWGSKLIKSFQFLLKTPMYWTSVNVLMISPDVLMISPWYTHGIPLVYWTSPNVLMISPNVLNTPGVLMISPDVLMWSPNVLMMYWIPPMYWTSPDLLNTH